MDAFGEVSKVSMDTSVFVGSICSRTLLKGRNGRKKEKRKKKERKKKKRKKKKRKMKTKIK